MTQFDGAYFRSVSGIFKCLELIFSFLGGLLITICPSGSTPQPSSPFFIGTIIAFLVALIIIVLYITGVSEALGSLMYLQAYYHAVWALYMMGYSSIIFHYASYSSRVDAIGSGISGILLAIILLMDTIHGFRRYPPMPFVD